MGFGSLYAVTIGIGWMGQVGRIIALRLLRLLEHLRYKITNWQTNNGA